MRYAGAMWNAQAPIAVETRGQGFVEFTARANAWLRDIEATEGLITLFCQHTSASLLICENASGAVRADLLRWLAKLAPESNAYAHDDEGPDDMPAHLRSVLTGNSLTVPVSNGRMTLGTWQGLFLAEHRARAHSRRIVLHFIGE